MIYTRKATERVYRKHESGFAEIHVEDDFWQITDVANEKLDSDEYAKQKPKKAATKEE